MHAASPGRAPGDHDTASGSVFPDAARQPCRHLLEEPAVPVRIPERGVAVVRGAIGIRTRNASAVQMEHLADVDAAADEIVTRRLDVGHDELQTLLRARRHLVAPEHRAEALADRERAARARGCELGYAEVVALDEVDVQPP